MNYHKCDGLKQHLLMSLQFCRSEFGSVEFSDQCLISEVSWLHSYLETWGRIQFRSHPGGQLNLFPFGCRTEVPVFQLVVAQESFLETRGHLLFPIMFPFHCKASNGNSLLSNLSQASNLFQKIPVSKIKKNKKIKKKKIPVHLIKSGPIRKVNYFVNHIIPSYSQVLPHSGRADCSDMHKRSGPITLHLYMGIFLCVWTYL